MRKILSLLFLFVISTATHSGARDFRPPTKVKPPLISPDGGHYDINQPVRVGIRAEPGAHIIYTLNGDFPSEGRGTRVENHITSFDLPPGDVTVMAIAVKPGLPRSPTARAEFTRSGRR